MNNYYRTIKWKLAQQAEWRWWRQYLAGRDPERYMGQKRAYWKGVLEQTDFKIEKDARILDAGCGPAGIFILYPEHDIVAVDPLLDQYGSKLDHFHPQNYPNVSFHASPLETWQPEGKFDVIFCVNAINHFRDMDAAMKVLARATHAGTRMLLAVDVHRHHWLEPVFRSVPADILHPHQGSEARYTELLSRHGWTIRSKHLLKQGRIFNYIGWVVERF